MKADLVLNSDHFVGYYETMKGEKERERERGREVGREISAVK